MVNQRLFAFWPYDLFPYMLGDEISEILPNNRVKAVGYGGAIFKNVIEILPYEHGKHKYELIEALREEYREAKDALHKTYMEKLKKIKEINFI